MNSFVLLLKKRDKKFFYYLNSIQITTFRMEFIPDKKNAYKFATLIIKKV